MPVLRPLEILAEGFQFRAGVGAAGGAAKRFPPGTRRGMRTGQSSIADAMHL